MEISNCMAHFPNLNFTHSLTFTYSRKCDHSWSNKLLRKPSGNKIFPTHLDHISVIGIMLFFPVVLSTMKVKVSRKNIDHKRSYDHSYVLSLFFFRKRGIF